MLAACLACGSRTPPASPGSDLSRLPAAGRGPLVALLPAPAAFAVAFRDARASWFALQGSPVVAGLDRAGAFDGLPALPLLERWEAIRGRLAELARLPLPPLTDLLAGPAVLARVGGDAGAPAGWLWVERLGPEARPALAFARVLNSIRSSASEVEVDVRHGISLRRVRLGASLEVTYFVIADRLVAGSDPTLVTAALDLALGGARTGPVPFPRLEAEAVATGFAAELAAPEGGGRPAIPGIRHASLAGEAARADLDPALWGDPDRRLPDRPGELAHLDAAGLELGPAWEAWRPARAADEPGNQILRDLDRVAAHLGRGLFFSAERTTAGAPGLRLTLAASSDASAEVLQLFADAVEDGADLRPEAWAGRGRLICPWGDDGPACLEVCPTELSIASRARLLPGSSTPCERLVSAAAASPLASLRVTDPTGGELLAGQIDRTGAGRWSAGARP